MMILDCPLAIHHKKGGVHNMEIEGDLEFIVYLGALFDVFVFVFDVFLFYGLYMLGEDIMLCV